MDGRAESNIVDLLRTTRTVAVVGASNRIGRPAYYVPKYLARNGYEVYPVNPRHIKDSLWGNRFAATLAELEQRIDLVNIFRRSQDVPGHLADILSMEPLPRAVWLQLGIRNDEVAAELRGAGIEVVQDRCILIEHQALDFAARARNRQPD